MSKQYPYFLSLVALLWSYSAQAAPSPSDTRELLVGDSDSPAYNASTPALLASSLGLTQRWVAAGPATAYASIKDGARDISEELSSWQLWNDTLFGGDWSNIAFLDDPFPPLEPGISEDDGKQDREEEKQVLQVDYPKGSYRQGGDASTGGATFFPSPRSLSASGASTALFSYEVGREFPAL